MGRSDRDLGFGVELLHGFRHHVRGVVPQQLEGRLGVVRVDDFRWAASCSIGRLRSRQLAVHANGDGVAARGREPMLRAATAKPSTGVGKASL